MAIFALKLILAHLLGDFVLQPTRWVEKKTDQKHRIEYLLLHAGVHLALLLLILLFSTQYVWGIVAIVVSHFIIDWLKLTIKILHPTALFFIDQLLHFLVIFAVVYAYFPQEINIEHLPLTELFLFANAILAITFVCNIVMQQLTKNLSYSIDEKNQSLDKAGRYIGMLERLFVFGFVVLNFWSGIGFLMAAKSIFRFGDLTRARDRKLTEYILIGTLLSFGFAILVGLVYRKILHLI